jgi:hypothetical protein
MSALPPKADIRPRDRGVCFGPCVDGLAGGINTMHLKDRFSDVETDCRDRLHDLAPPNRGTSAGTHIHGTHVPVEEPSTASEADILHCSKERRSSITSSARTINDRGTLRPSGLAGLKPDQRSWCAFRETRARRNFSSGASPACS